MENNDAWVEDVRRWYFNGTRAHTVTAVKPARRSVEADPPVLGYEAAHPALQSKNWASPADSRFGALG